MWQRADGWAAWFLINAPDAEYFLYLIDESGDFARINSWAQALNNNPGVGRQLMSFATLKLPEALPYTPELDIFASRIDVGVVDEWQSAADAVHADPGKRVFLYNGARPASGSFGIEDEGVALRELAWGQLKKNIDRWFYWESTYYNNYQAGAGQTNVFQRAQTFGQFSRVDAVVGETGWNYSNGDGVLFYPGTDSVFPGESYAIAGPIASLRLKHWRRGVQDADYLALARQIAPVRVQEIINRMVPKVLWENGVNDPADPTWVLCDISWSTDPDAWEAARAELAALIEAGAPAAAP
jgi:hypothetical protein